jgi:putative endonuclease
MWYVYLLKCSDSSLYCGITNNIEDRIATHNNGKGAKYTRSRLPVELYWFEEQNDRSSASKREYAIKKLSRKDKIKLKNPLD